MTPPKVGPNQSPPPKFTCEKPTLPETIVYVPEGAIYAPLEDPTVKKLEISFQVPGVYQSGYFRDLTTWSPRLGSPPLISWSPFDPHQFGLGVLGTPPAIRQNFLDKIEHRVDEEKPLTSTFSEDPTQYGLPADWQPKSPPITAGERFAVLEGDAVQQWISNSKDTSDVPSWLPDVLALLNQVERADLDMYNISVNQGANFRRFSEYAPKGKPLKDPNLSVQEGTTAYVHGEIRPVEGQKDSLITRWVIQYDKPLLHESKLHIQGFSAVVAPDIEYDTSFSDWQAVKDISDDELDYENPLKSGAPMKTDFNSVAPPLPGGHRDWIIAFNPVEDSIVASIKAAGGFGKLDFLDFWPMASAIEGGRGKLYLWAFNPTIGLGISPSCEEKRKAGVPEKELSTMCKVRPNTMPRKPSELVEFFSPLMDSYRSGLLKNASPYYNPNSEYIAPFMERGQKLLAWAKLKLGRDYAQPKEACEDLKGRWKEETCILPLPKNYRDIFNVNEDRTQGCCEAQGGKWQREKEDKCVLPFPKKFKIEECEQPLIGRQPLPRDYSRVEKINQELRRLGLPELPRRRGSIIDWFNQDLMHDPERLHHMKDKPHMEMHFKFKPGRISLPTYGEVEIHPKTNLVLQYYADAVQVPDLERPGQLKWEAQLGLNVTLKPLRLAKTNLKIKGFHLTADSLMAKELRVNIPNLLGMNETQPHTRRPITATILGGKAQNLHFTREQGDVDIRMAEGNLEKFEFHMDRPTLLFGSDEAKRQDRLARLFMPNSNPDPSCVDGNNPNAPELGATFTGLTGKGLQVGLPQLKGLTVAAFRIPTVQIHQSFKTTEAKTVSDLLTVDIPELNSQGSTDLDLTDLNVKKDQEKELKSKGQVVHFEGNSVLKNIHLSSKFNEDHLLLKGSFDLSGIIDRVTLTKEELGEISLTTKTNGHATQPLSGHIDLESVIMSKGEFQAERPKGPPPKFDIDLDLPYVGLESVGAFTIPPDSATLRNGLIKLHGENEKVSGNISGEVNLQNASYEHHKKALELGRMDVIPALTQGHAQGYFNLEILEEGAGFRLSNPYQNPKDKKHYNPKDEAHPPIRMGFKLVNTLLHHCPELPDGISSQAGSEPVATNVQLSSGVEMQNLGAFEVRKQTVDGETKYAVTDIESGPLFIRNVEGSGQIIMSLGMIPEVLSFAQLGGALSEKEKDYLPDPRVLTAGLPEERRKKIQEEMAEGDYLYSAGLTFDRKKGGWAVTARDVIFNLHEVGGLKQFVMARFPQITIGMIGDKLLPINYYDHLARTRIIFPSHGYSTANLNTPERWRQAERKLKE